MPDTTHTLWVNSYDYLHPIFWTRLLTLLENDNSPLTESQFNLCGCDLTGHSNHDAVMHTRDAICDLHRLLQCMHQPELSIPPSKYIYGLIWIRSTAVCKTDGILLYNDALEAALEHKTIFSEREWNKFGIVSLTEHHYIDSKGVYFKPKTPVKTRPSSEDSLNLTASSDFWIRFSMSLKAARDWITLNPTSGLQWKEIDNPLQYMLTSPCILLTNVTLQNALSTQYVFTQTE